MSDGMGGAPPNPLPQSQPGFLLAGSPIVIANQMPAVNPGSTPIAVGNWQKAHTVVDRKAVTMLVIHMAPASATIFRFGARVGVATTCPHAATADQIRSSPRTLSIKWHRAVLLYLSIRHVITAPVPRRCRNSC
jgi:hypothetical protein